jgi:hypothetical protein
MFLFRDVISVPGHAIAFAELFDEGLVKVIGVNPGFMAQVEEKVLIVKHLT